MAASSISDSLMIVPLADRPALVPVVAGWLVSEWGGTCSARSRSAIEAALQARLNTKTPPIAFVAIEAGKPVGTASLNVRELAERSQYQYWLGAGFIPLEHRGRGMGGQLVQHVEWFA